MCLKNWTRLDTWGAILASALLTVVIGAGSGVLLLTTLDKAFPVSYWYELKAVSVETPVAMGELVRLSPTRTIHRDFNGHYSVRVTEVGATYPICAGGVESLPYRRASHESQPLAAVTLDWWTAGAEPPCQSVLTPGRFLLETCVFVHPHGLLGVLLGHRQTCIISNEFEVTE